MGRRSKTDDIKSLRIFFGFFALFWNGILITIFATIFLANGGQEFFHQPWKFLFFIPFVLVGIGVAVLALNPKVSARLAATSSSDSGLPSLVSLEELNPRSGKVELQPKVSAAGKLVGITLVSLFWNGVVSVFLFNWYQDMTRGHINWFIILFLSPFVLIGLGMIAGIFYYLLALLNPRPTLRLKSTRVKPGESFDIDWQLSGQVDRIENLKVFIQGREEATYRRGTSTYTDRSVFAKIDLADVRGTSRIRQGNVKASIPSDTMHSFNGSNNKIIWEICVQGEIPKWPDVNESFEFTVIPFEESELKRIESD